MSKVLERLMRERLERERKRAEREEKKRQKELAKKEEKRKKHHKVMRSRQNRRYYKKKRKAVLAEHEKIGDVYAYHMVLIMRNNCVVERIGAAWWRSTAYKIYNEAIKKNREEVKFPLQITEQATIGKTEVRTAQKEKYEIMIVQKIKEGENHISHFRDEYGKLVEHVIINDKESHVIVDKDAWYVPETFKVYGYHPVRDRKDFDFILNEMVLNRDKHTDIRRVFTYLNKLIIQYDLDFDFVTCKTKDEAKRLYNTLEKYVGETDYVFFTGTLNSTEQTNRLLNKMEEKTGWTRIQLKRYTTI